MLAPAYGYEEDDDRRLHGAFEAPIANHGEAGDAARGGNQAMASHSLAEINARYGGPGAGDAADIASGPSVDQLSLHGVAPEPAHVDPAATAVAQTEIETGASAAPSREPPAPDAVESDGPEVGAVAPSAPAGGGEGAPDGGPAPGPVLAGAAQSLNTAATETPAAGTTGKPAPAAAPTAGPGPAAATGAPAAGGGPAHAASWQDAARAYNQHHGLVEKFNAATHNACGSGSDADPEAVHAWQKAHGIPADGRIGPVTVGAAMKPVAKTAAHSDEHTDKPDDKHADKHADKPADKPAAKVDSHTDTPAKVAKPVEPAPAAQTPAVAPTAGGPDAFVGTDDRKGPGKDRWTSYGKDDKKTYGWDLQGTHGVKHSGGDVSAAIYAVSNVEGRYDSVQTYDSGILSFGIMQWTLHAGSLQKFLGFLKDKSGPEGRAAFQDDFVAKGIDVKPAGGEYQLWYNGKEYPLGDHGAGKAAIDKLVREDKDSARKWSEIFAAAGADPRVQKAQFERAKEMYKETVGIKFGPRIVDQSLKACKNTFHAKYRDQYGKAETWMSASPKAATLYFSMRVNNPMYANAAFLKAIDAFYDAHTTDRAKWPANWGDDFGSLVDAKCKETLSNWHSEGGNEGRVEKTLRFWNKAHGQPAAPSSTTATQEKPKTAQVANNAAHKPDGGTAGKPEARTDAKAEAKLDEARIKQLRAQYAAIMKQFLRGKIDQGEAVKQLILYDQKLHGGTPSIEGLILVPILLGDLVKATLARSGGASATKAKSTSAHDTKTPPAPPAVDTSGRGGTWTPPADTSVTDEGLAKMASDLHNPQADKIMKDLGGVLALAKKLGAHLSNKEIHGADRENLVAGIGVVRKEVDALPANDPKIAAFAIAVNHKLQTISPYHAQVNIRTIETGAYTTCNVTSLAMSLETIGKNADSYSTAKRPHILAAARVYAKDITTAKLASHGTEITWDSLRGLRLPDFMEMAAIAHTLKGAEPSDDEVKAAALFAAKTKTHLDFLAEIAGDFGAKGTYHTARFDGHAKDLAKFSDDVHTETDMLVDARNRAEANPKDEKLKAKYEALLARMGPKINGGQIEQQLPVATYKSIVRRDVGPHLDAGAGIIAGTWNHFTHAFEITNDHIKVQDPGQYHRSERKILWDEARALKYFWNYIVIK